jgi:hypothetical protein
MKLSSFILLTFLSATVLVVSCDSSSRNSANREQGDVHKPISESKDIHPSLVSAEDSSRKMICTANIDCEVKDVLNAESSIRKLTTEKGGFIELSDVQSDKRYLSKVECSRDSVIEYSMQTMHANMIVRVPDDSLQQVLDEISGYAVRVEKKVLKAEDVSLDILSSQFTLNRNLGSTGDKDISNRRTDSLAYDADQAVLSGLDLMDKVNYSTIQISLKQNEYLVAGVTQNVDAIRAKSSPFWLRMADSLSYGWAMLETFIVFIFRFWALFVLLFLIYVGYKKWMPISRFLSLNKQA